MQISRSSIEGRISRSRHLLFDDLVLDRRILSTTVRKELSQRGPGRGGEGEGDKSEGGASLFLLEAIYFGQYSFPDVAADTRGKMILRLSSPRTNGIVLAKNRHLTRPSTS